MKTNHKGSSRAIMLAWGLFDWATSSFAVVIQTFVFASYFASHVASNDVEGTRLWGNALGIAGLIVALGGPLIGAVADCSGHRKRYLAFFLVCCALVTALMWGIQPSSNYIWPALILFAIGTITEEYAYIFYNSMLPSLAPQGEIGRWSGWGWSLGYFGGTACLCTVLLAYNLYNFLWPGFEEINFGAMRIAFPLAALWMLVFSLPLFLYVPDRSQATLPIGTAIRSGLKQFMGTLRQIRSYSNILRFFIARTIFIDGMSTLFAFGGIYAAGTFNLSEEAILLFGISLNIAAGVGAALFAWVDDWLGSKSTLMIALFGLMVTCTAILLVDSEWLFWTIGLCVGMCIGPAQATSRSLLARMAPPELQTQMFGFFAVSGKATAFMGPFMVGWITYWTSSQRWGMAAILLFFAVGAAILKGVKYTQRTAQPDPLAAQNSDQAALE